jgi:hypothetical protein
VAVGGDGGGRSVMAAVSGEILGRRGVWEKGLFCNMAKMPFVWGKVATTCPRWPGLDTCLNDIWSISIRICAKCPAVFYDKGCVAPFVR